MGIEVPLKKAWNLTPFLLRCGVWCRGMVAKVVIRVRIWRKSKETYFSLRRGIMGYRGVMVKVGGDCRLTPRCYLGRLWSPLKVPWRDKGLVVAHFREQIKDILKWLTRVNIATFSLYYLLRWPLPLK